MIVISKCVEAKFFKKKELCESWKIVNVFGKKLYLQNNIKKYPLCFDFKCYKLCFERKVPPWIIIAFHLFYNECFHSKNFIAVYGYVINIHVFRHKRRYAQDRENQISFLHFKTVLSKSLYLEWCSFEKGTHLHQELNVRMPSVLTLPRAKASHC